MNRFLASRSRLLLRAVAAAGLISGVALGDATLAHARELAGHDLPEQTTVAGTPLALNGAGVRYKAVFKVYIASLYLPTRSAVVDDALSVQMPRRLSITMLREIDADELGKMFTRGLQDNLDRSAAARLTPAILRMSKVFSDRQRLKAGESFHIDWVPGTGMVLTINGQSAGEPFRDPAFFQALMRIWLGEKPADWQLKDALLGRSSDSS